MILLVAVCLVTHIYANLKLFFSMEIGLQSARNLNSPPFSRLSPLPRSCITRAMAHFLSSANGSAATSPVEWSREQPLYERNMLVHLLSGSESNTSELTLRILSSKRNADVNNAEKVLHFEVTDDTNPIFLYDVDISGLCEYLSSLLRFIIILHMSYSEQDFHLLKREQNLLIEFNVFSAKVIELLSLCKDNEETENKAFILTLDVVNGLLSIVEINKFKQLNHICLQMRPGNDSSLKAYLAARFLMLNELSHKQFQEIKNLNSTLNNVNGQNSSLSKELLEIKMNRDAEYEKFSSKYKEEFSLLQIKSMESVEKYRLQYETQRDNLQNMLDSSLMDFNSKIISYESKIEALTSEKNASDNVVRDVTRNLAAIESERDRLQSDVAKYMVEKVTIEETVFSLEKELLSTKGRVESLLSQLKDKEEIITHTNVLNKSSEDNRFATEDRHKLLQTNFDILNEKLKMSVLEIDKGNKYITLLQNEVKNLRILSKNKVEVIRRQEVVSNDYKNKVVSLEQQVKASNDVHLQSKQAIHLLQIQLNDANDRIKQSTALIENNQDVISYLNEEINRWQLGVGKAQSSGNSAGLAYKDFNIMQQDLSNYTAYDGISMHQISSDF